MNNMTNYVQGISWFWISFGILISIFLIFVGYKVNQTPAADKMQILGVSYFERGAFIMMNGITILFASLIGAIIKASV